MAIVARPNMRLARITSRTRLSARPVPSAKRAPSSKSRSSVGPRENSSTSAPPIRLIAATFFGSRSTVFVGISGPITTRSRSASTGNVRTSAWAGAPGWSRRSIPPKDAGTTSPRPVPHSTSVSCAMATSSSRGTWDPRASSRARAVLKAAAALTPNPCETGRFVSLRIFTSQDRSPRTLCATRWVTSAFWRRPFTMTSIEERASSRTRATVWTPRSRHRPAPREPFFRGSGSSWTSKNTVTCPGQNASPSDTMEDGPPHPLGREGLRPFERLRATLAVEDRNRRRVPLDLGDVVRHDEVDVRLFDEGHRTRLPVRLADARFRLEADQGLLRALAEPIEALGRWLQVQTQNPIAARDLAGFLRRREVRYRGRDDADVRVCFLSHRDEICGRLESLERKPWRYRRFVSPEPELHVRAVLEGDLGEFDSRPARRAVRHDTDVVDRLNRRSGHDQHAHVDQVLRAESADDMGHDRLDVRHLCFLFLAFRFEQFDAKLLEAPDVRGHGRVVHHRFVGRRGHDDRDAGTERVRGIRRDGGVVDPLRDLANRVRGARRDQEEVRLSVPAAHLEVLHRARDLRDHGMTGCVLQRVGVEDLCRRSGKDRVDVGSVADELMGQFHALDRGDAPGHAEDDRLALELEALQPPQALGRMHSANDCHTRYIAVAPRRTNEIFISPSNL